MANEAIELGNLRTLDDLGIEVVSPEFRLDAGHPRLSAYSVRHSVTHSYLPLTTGSFLTPHWLGFSVHRFFASKFTCVTQ